MHEKLFFSLAFKICAARLVLWLLWYKTYTLQHCVSMSFYRFYQQKNTKLFFFWKVLTSRRSATLSTSFASFMQNIKRHTIKLHVPLSIRIDNERLNDGKSTIIITLNISILYLIRYVNWIFVCWYMRMQESIPQTEYERVLSLSRHKVNAFCPTFRKIITRFGRDSSFAHKQKHRASHLHEKPLYVLCVITVH